MLNIFLKEEGTNIEEGANIPEVKLIHDIEKAFLEVKLTGSQIEKDLLREIEQAEYVDAISFKDRFGYKLYTTELSTGCKSALCVLNYPDKIIDTIECGLNARDAIICFCKKGNILMYDNGITIRDLSDTIDVSLDSYKFTDVDNLNKYIDIRPMKCGGN